MDIALRIVVVIPVYNDWQSFKQLVHELSKVSSATNWSIENIIAVNDGSYESVSDFDFSSKISVTILCLNNNMGHQRAISIGLSYVEDHFKNIDNVVVMDSDGEDRPIDLDKLLKALEDNSFKKIIFAKREKRSEGFIFKFFYQIYKFIFYALTKQKLDFGNFSCIPRQLLSKVVSIPEIWNHYSGGIIKSKIPYVVVGTDRGNRYHGESKMNFQNLVLHGLSSISIYLDVVSVRLLFASFFSASIAILGLLFIGFMMFFTDVVIPDWSSFVALALLIVLVIVILITFLTLLFQLNQKANVKFPPRKFYKDFILSITKF